MQLQEGSIVSSPSLPAFVTAKSKTGKVSGQQSHAELEQEGTSRFQKLETYGRKGATVSRRGIAVDGLKSSNAVVVVRQILLV